MNNQPSQLKEHYTFSDFLYYTSLAAVPFFTAFYAIYSRSAIGFVFYAVMCILAVVLLYRYYCSHCPHYTREGKTTRCLFFWGVPKFFPRRPEPLGFWNKCVAVTTPLALIIFPLFWLFRQPGLLVIFILSLTVFLATIRRNECRRCIYRDCPVNKTPHAFTDKAS